MKCQYCKKEIAFGDVEPKQWAFKRGNKNGYIMFCSDGCLRWHEYHRNFKAYIRRCERYSPSTAREMLDGFNERNRPKCPDPMKKEEEEKVEEVVKAEAPAVEVKLEAPAEQKTDSVQAEAELACLQEQLKDYMRVILEKDEVIYRLKKLVKCYQDLEMLDKRRAAVIDDMQMLMEDLG